MKTESFSISWARNQVSVVVMGFKLQTEFCEKGVNHLNPLYGEIIIYIILLNEKKKKKSITLVFK